MGKNLRVSGMSPSARHLLISLGSLSLVLVMGTVGYMLIESLGFSDALYMTVITISTVGFGEVSPLSSGGRYLTIAIIAFGVSAMLLSVSAVLEFMLSEFFGIWGRRRMDTRIARLVDHYIVCGYGRVGRSVAEELDAQGYKFVVIEIEENTYQQCVNDGYLAINGSATDNDNLAGANIADAQGLVSALSSGADNVYVILSARMKNPSLLLVARADEPESKEKLALVGADRVISPHAMAGKRMANMLIRPRICEFVDVWVGGGIPEYQLTELKVSGESSFKGVTIKDTRLRERTGATVLAIRKMGEDTFNGNPEPDIRIEEGDLLILVGTSEQMGKMRELNLLS
ncbi:MAG: potassium channel protein [Actinobacteria bacterium]|nr:potassium channel protein [Actinomycetota bacterium]